LTRQVSSGVAILSWRAQRRMMKLPHRIEGVLV
jgi:hypothetical protein